jgi:hypothetical protein
MLSCLKTFIMGNLKLYECVFVGVWPVGNCCIILAFNYNEALKIARETITHTTDIKVEEVEMDKPKVVVYLSGDY